MSNIKINTHRDGYTIGQCHNTMTVEQLINVLQDFEPEAHVYLSFDNDYTYGSISEYDIQEIED